MRTAAILPNYVIDVDGSVFNKENGEPVEVEKTGLEKGKYKLQTSEKFFCSIKKKTIELVRRLSPKDIAAIYQRSSDKAPVQVKEKPKDKAKAKNAEKSKTAGRGVLIDGKQYDSASEASKAIGVAVNTIINRCKGDSKFETYSFI